MGRDGCLRESFSASILSIFSEISAPLTLYPLSASGIAIRPVPIPGSKSFLYFDGGNFPVRKSRTALKQPSSRARVSSYTAAIESKDTDSTVELYYLHGKK